MTRLAVRSCVIAALAYLAACGSRQPAQESVDVPAVQEEPAPASGSTYEQDDRDEEAATVALAPEVLTAPEAPAAMETDAASEESVTSEAPAATPVARDTEPHPEDAAQCRRSEWCRVEGRCGYDRSRHECQASSEAECRRSLDCQRHGRCRYVRACPATDPCAGLEGSRCEP